MTIHTKFHTGRYDHTFLSLVTFDNEFLKQIIYESLNIKVEKAKIINSKMAKKRLMERANYLDLVVETEIGYINIEVSNNNYNKYSAHRNFIYLTTLIGNVTKVGMRLKDMPKVYQINLIFEDKNNVCDIDKYNLCSLMTKKILTEKIEIVNVYMDKLKEMYYNGNKKLTNGLSLIALSMTREELEESKEESIVFEKLLKKLDEMEDKGLAPELMPIEEENKWYREMLIQNAKEEAVEENKFSIACNMLKEKIDINLISKITGLSLKEIKNISNGQ